MASQEQNNYGAERPLLQALENSALYFTPPTSPCTRNNILSTAGREHVDRLQLHFDNKQNDDAERSLLQSSQNSVANFTPPPTPGRSRNNILRAEKQHLLGCYKLYFFNKIKKNNVWDLQLIDIMASMLQRHDTWIENLSSSSLALDAAMGIYAIRVDAIYEYALKMARGLCKLLEPNKYGQREENRRAPDGKAAAPADNKKKIANSSIVLKPGEMNLHTNEVTGDEPLGHIHGEEEADIALVVESSRAAPHDARLEYLYSDGETSKMPERIQSTVGDLMAEGEMPPPHTIQPNLDAGLTFDIRADPVREFDPTQPIKISRGRKTRIKRSTWNEPNFRTPSIGRGLDESHFRENVQRCSVRLLNKRKREPSFAAHEQPTEAPEPLAHKQRTEAPESLAHEQPTEAPGPLALDAAASHCTNDVPDDDIRGNEDGLAAGELHNHTDAAELESNEEMYEPPTEVEKIFIPHATQAKQVNMKELKQSTWQIITEEDDQNETVAPTTFSSVYSRLPNKLSTHMQESLSPSLALLSILDLATERGLILKNSVHMKDVAIMRLNN